MSGHKCVIINTNSEVDIIDITDDLVTTIEFETVLQKDFPYELEKIVPKNEY